MVSISFNGTEVNNPVEWEEMTVSIEYDHVNQITTISYDQQLTFFGDGYEYLYSRRNDTCQVIDVQITSECNGEYIVLKGGIFITDCTFNETKCSVEVTIQDDGYSTRIQNNKAIDVSLASTTTKNGEAITAPTETTLQLFNPTVGTYTEGLVRTYRVYEAFKFIVSWISDNSVSFESDYFDTGDGSIDHICSGLDLRNHDTPVNRAEAPTISFEDLYEVMRKMKNLAIGFQRDSSNNPVLRIEPLSYFRNNTNGIQITNPNRTELSYIKELLYAKVRIGSTIILPNECNDGNSNCAASNNISYYGFQEEEYYITGECNENVDLDLTMPQGFIVDTNTIEDVIIYNNDSYDRDVFFIQADATSPTIAKATDVFGIGAFWYNEDYTNKEILARYIDYLTGVLNLFSLYNGLNLFLYEGTNNSGKLLPLQAPSYTRYPTTAGNGFPMNSIIYDPQGRIDTGTERFTPVDEGNYKFCVGINVDEFAGSPPAVTIFFYLQIEVYDSTATLINTYQSDLRSYLTSASPNFEEWESPYIPMDSGDFAVFTISYAQNVNPAIIQGEVVFGVVVTENNYFQCCDSRVAVQDIQTNTGQNRRIAKTSTEYPVDLVTFKSFYDDTTKLIGIANQHINRTGWNDSFKYRLHDGLTEISILSNDV